MICRITDSAIDMDELTDSLDSPELGGLCTFVGKVRNHSAGQGVTHLEYHAYPAMAEKKMRQVADEIEERFGVAHLAMAHRVGTLAIGDIAVGIAAASAHRDAAFKACRYAIRPHQADRADMEEGIRRRRRGMGRGLRGGRGNSGTSESAKRARLTFFPLKLEFTSSSNESRRPAAAFDVFDVFLFKHI